MLNQCSGRELNKNQFKMQQNYDDEGRRDDGNDEEEARFPGSPPPKNNNTSLQSAGALNQSQGKAAVKNDS